MKQFSIFSVPEGMNYPLDLNFGSIPLKWSSQNVYIHPPKGPANRRLILWDLDKIWTGKPGQKVDSLWAVQSTSLSKPPTKLAWQKRNNQPLGFDRPRKHSFFRGTHLKGVQISKLFDPPTKRVDSLSASENIYSRHRRVNFVQDSTAPVDSRPMPPSAAASPPR